MLLFGARKNIYLHHINRLLAVLLQVDSFQFRNRAIVDRALSTGADQFKAGAESSAGVAQIEQFFAQLALLTRKFIEPLANPSVTARHFRPFRIIAQVLILESRLWPPVLGDHSPEVDFCLHQPLYVPMIGDDPDQRSFTAVERPVMEFAGMRDFKLVLQLSVVMPGALSFKRERVIAA